MVLAHPRAPRAELATGPRSRPNLPRPRTLGGPRAAIGRPRFEALRALALTPLDEVRALDARAFAELPVPTVLELDVPGWSGPVWVRSAPGRGIATRDPVLDGPAWRALVDATESDRVRPIDFRHLLGVLATAEQDESACALREIDALVDGVSLEMRCWTVGRVIERLGARLFSVRVEEPTSAEPASGGPEHAANGPVLAVAG